VIAEGIYEECLVCEGGGACVTTDGYVFTCPVCEEGLVPHDCAD
jgi:hypothetical protein